MPCIHPDGTLTVTAARALSFLEKPSSDTEIADHVHIPLYRVRSLLRELMEAGYIFEDNGKYHRADNNDEGEEEIDLPDAF